MSSQTLHFGLLLLPNYQWLDAAGPVDYLNNHSQDFLKLFSRDPAFVAKGPIIVWHYIAADLQPVRATSGPAQLPTCTYTDCPPLDVLIVPGPDPTVPLADECVALLRRLLASERFKNLLTVCTSTAAMAQTDLLNGLHVCSNKYFLREFADAGLLNRKVKWAGDRRWVKDGKVWSAAGITAGVDLAAEFARVHFDPEVVRVVKDVSEYEPLPDQPDVFARMLEGVKLD